MDVQSVIKFVVVALAVIPAIVFHEVAHGYVANAFGDRTAKDAGRLSLNPLKHVDLMGTLILPAVLYLTMGVAFGYAKPVPVNVGRLRKPREQSFWVSLAGPGTNFILLLVAIAVGHLPICDWNAYAGADLSRSQLGGGVGAVLRLGECHAGAVQPLANSASRWIGSY